MKLTMLGSGHAVVHKLYNTCFVLEEGHHCFLVDGGGGGVLLTRLKQAGINLFDIHHIFVTHKHLDHIMGIIWLMRMLSMRRKDHYYIYSHEEVIRILEINAELLLTREEYETLGTYIHMVTLEDGDCRLILNHPVTFFDIGSTKCRQFGFVMDYGDNKRLLCCGDEPYYEYYEDYVQGTTFMMHDAFCLEEDKDKYQPHQKHHSTVKDAALNAKKLNVSNLLLFHTEDQTGNKRKELYTQEAKKYFPGNIYVPDDLEVIEL